uniref:Uncharacterized protein n=1 Tax=Pithovirus LCPAC102 TaxID=2506587 RepID=A0A4D5XF65_9VIRU|nr:MAG: uncharacterized protein LCPAC102_01630 [Pithovirus LCPAC102]
MNNIYYNKSEIGIYIVLIIITIVGYILFIFLSIYFLFIPAIRANSIFNNIFELGNVAINDFINISNKISKTNAETQAIAVGFCELNNGLSEGVKELFWGNSFDNFCENLDIVIPESCE